MMIKTWARSALLKNESPEFRKVSNFLALLTIVSIVSLVFETVPSLTAYNTLFLVIEWVAVAFFSLEYISRLYFTNPKKAYVLSFFGIIDLVSILPTILGLGNFTFLKSARAFRILRLLRMLRLAKLARPGATVDESMSVLSLNILIYFTTLLTALLITGTAMYLVEPDSEVFLSIPAGMWWSLKVFMAGISVFEPQTGLGEIFYVFTRFVGLLLLGLLVGVVGNVFRIILMGRK